MRYFRVIEQTPELKVGAILRGHESCTKYECLDRNYFIDSENIRIRINFTKKTVETQPQWFEEVQLITIYKPIKINEIFKI